MGRVIAHEKELRVARAGELLEKVCRSIGEKSLLLQMKVRNASTHMTKGRAWSEVRRAERLVQKFVALYNLNLLGLLRLNVGQEILTQFRPITDSDTQVPKDITEENRFGQRDDTMPWIWRVDAGGVPETGSWMEECAFIKPLILLHANVTQSPKSELAQSKGPVDKIRGRTQHCAAGDDFVEIVL